MNFAQDLLNRLKARQQQHAVDALSRPNTRDAFEYGYRAGVYEGYTQSINVLLTMLDEEKNLDKDL